MDLPTLIAQIYTDAERIAALVQGVSAGTGALEANTGRLVDPLRRQPPGPTRNGNIRAR